MFFQEPDLVWSILYRGNSILTRPKSGETAFIWIHYCNYFSQINVGLLLLIYGLSLIGKIKKKTRGLLPQFIDDAEGAMVRGDFAYLKDAFGFIKGQMVNSYNTEDIVIQNRSRMSESDLNSNQINNDSRSNHQQATFHGKPTTELVNVEREGKGGVTMIDRTSRFGNKFVLEEDGGSYSREESVEEYREWFKKKIKKDPDFRKDVNELQGETLGCWCKPKLCHGDVILDYLRGKMELDERGWRFDEDELTQTKLNDFFNGPPTSGFDK